MDPEKFVFLDESGASTNMARLYGRGLGGSRLVGAAPHAHWNTSTTFLAALRPSKIVAPLALNAPTTGATFRAYAEKLLAPAHQPGDVVVIVTLPANEVAGVRAAIAATGASVLYLPPYSPNFNPIQRGFVKLKALLRKAAVGTREALWDAIAAVLVTWRGLSLRHPCQMSARTRAAGPSR